MDGRGKRQRRVCAGRGDAERRLRGDGLIDRKTCACGDNADGRLRQRRPYRRIVGGSESGGEIGLQSAVGRSGRGLLREAASDIAEQKYIVRDASRIGIDRAADGARP